MRKWLKKSDKPFFHDTPDLDPKIHGYWIHYNAYCARFKAKFQFNPIRNRIWTSDLQNRMNWNGSIPKSFDRVSDHPCSPLHEELKWDVKFWWCQICSIKCPESTSFNSTHFGRGFCCSYTFLENAKLERAWCTLVW